MKPDLPKPALITLFACACIFGYFWFSDFDASSGSVRQSSFDSKTDSPLMAQAELRTQRLEIVSGSGQPVVTMGESPERSPGMWFRTNAGANLLQVGLHGDGWPFMLVTDPAIRTFGLSRVDGLFSSPIMVLRENDNVALVMGLDMTSVKKNPFLVYYDRAGKKQLLFGEYCDNPNRVCTQ